MLSQFSLLANPAFVATHQRRHQHCHQYCHQYRLELVFSFEMNAKRGNHACVEMPPHSSLMPNKIKFDVNVHTIAITK